jgi:hypothetical protein
VSEHDSPLRSFQVLICSLSFKHMISLNPPWHPSCGVDDNESLLTLLSITHYAAGPANLDTYIYLLFVQLRRVTAIRGISTRTISQDSLPTAHRSRQSPTEERVYRVTVSSVCTGSSRAAHQFGSIYRQKIVVFRISPTAEYCSSEIVRLKNARCSVVLDI